MERNLYILKGFPFFPTRSGVSANTGPFESNLMAMATSTIIGEKMSKIIMEKKMSKTRFDTSYSGLFFISVYDIMFRQGAKLFDDYKKGSYKLRHDPRITRVGTFIRKHSLDEVPQLFNVLRGEMSLVGPRAYYPDELREQQKKYPNTRDAVKVVLSVKPGITGFWQVSGRSAINFDKRIDMDANYVEKRSILYDMVIVLKTPWAMISGEGAL